MKDSQINLNTLGILAMVWLLLSELDTPFYFPQMFLISGLVCGVVFVSFILLTVVKEKV